MGGVTDTLDTNGTLLWATHHADDLWKVIESMHKRCNGHCGTEACRLVKDLYTARRGYA